MTLHDYLRIFRERWAIVVAAVLVGLLAAGAAWCLRPERVHRAADDVRLRADRGHHAERLPGRPALAAAGDLLRRAGGQHPRDRARSSADSGWPSRRSTSPSRSSASSALDSVLIDVAVTDRSPQRAADIANAVGQVFGAPRRRAGAADDPRRPAARRGARGRSRRPSRRSRRRPACPSCSGSACSPACCSASPGRWAATRLDTSVKSPDAAAGAGRRAEPRHRRVRPAGARSDPSPSTRTRSRRGPRRSGSCGPTCSSSTSTGRARSSPSPARCRARARRRRWPTWPSRSPRQGTGCSSSRPTCADPKLADLLGLDRSIGLTSVLAGRVDAGARRPALVRRSGRPRRAGRCRRTRASCSASRQMANLLAQLRDEYDIVLVDTPPLLPGHRRRGGRARRPTACCWSAGSRRPAATSCATAVQAIDAVSAPVLGTVFTMVPASGPRAYAQYNAYYRTELPTSRSARKASPPTGLPGPRNVAPLPPPGFHRPSPRREASHTAQPTAHRRPAG